MPVLHTVFDTNIYRGLPLDRAVSIKECERAQSVQALAAFVPALELGARLAAATADQRRPLIAAFVALWRHTKLYNGWRDTLPLLHDSDSQLAWGLFRRTLKHRAEEADVFGYALGAVGSRTDGQVPNELQGVLAAIQAHVRSREAKFTADMRQLVRTLDPAASGWQPHSADAARRRALLTEVKSPAFLEILAKSRVSAAADLCGIALTETEEKYATTEVLQSFPTAICFFRNLVVGMIESGTDFSRTEHANSAWDIALAFVASPQSSVQRVPALLVTNERRFHRAAADAGHSEFVVTFEAYEELLARRVLWDYAEALQAKSA